MTDKWEDPNGELSQQLQSITTIDPNVNINEQIAHDTNVSMPKFKNSTSMSAIHERKKKSCSLDDNYLSRDMPGTNLPEKIVFVVDTVREPDCTPYETRAGAKFSPLYMIKRIIEMFVNVKTGIQAKHEYALVALKADTVSWLCNFTNNRKTFLANLEKLSEDPIIDDQQPYDLGPCFEIICENAGFEDAPRPAIFVGRTILIYSRSHSIPQFITGRHFFDRLCMNSHFYLDSLYVHEPLSEDNDCQNIYEKLGSLDTKQTSYILEVGRNAANIHTNMAKLIAHPMQRSRQGDSPYTVYNPGSLQDLQTNL